MLKPIPLKLLIHSATYEEFIESQRYEETFKQPITLKNIRMNFETSLNRASDSATESIKATMFFDLVNSKATGPFEFKEKSKVTFEGQQMQVQKVSPFYSNKIHHYEVELS